MNPQLLTANEENGIEIEDFQEKDRVNSYIQHHDGQSIKSKRRSGSSAGSGSSFDGNSFKGSFTQGLTTEEAKSSINQNHEDMSRSPLHSIARSGSDVASDWGGDSLRRSSSNTLKSTPIQPVQSAHGVAATRKRITRKVQLDPDTPGAWLIEHHEQNIITKLLRPGERMPLKPLVKELKC